MALGLVVGIATLGVISFRAVVERLQQIGMVRAIGYQRGMVVASFLIESTMITVTGVVSGAALGLLLSWQVLGNQDFSGSTASQPSLIPGMKITVFKMIAIDASLLMALHPGQPDGPGSDRRSAVLRVARSGYGSPGVLPGTTTPELIGRGSNGDSPEPCARRLEPRALPAEAA